MTIHTTPQLTGPIQLSRASFNIPVKPSACPAGFREALIAQLDVHWADASFASDGRLTVEMDMLTAGPPLTEMMDVLNQAWAAAAGQCQECYYCGQAATHYIFLPQNPRFLCDACATICRDVMAKTNGPMPIEEIAS